MDRFDDGLAVGSERATQPLFGFTSIDRLDRQQGRFTHRELSSDLASAPSRDVGLARKRVAHVQERLHRHGPKLARACVGVHLQSLAAHPGGLQ